MTTNAEHTVIVTRAALNRAEQEAAKERGAKLVEEVGKVRAEKAKAEAAYLPLANQIKAEHEFSTQGGVICSGAPAAVDYKYLLKFADTFKPRPAEYCLAYN